MPFLVNIEPSCTSVVLLDALYLLSLMITSSQKALKSSVLQKFSLAEIVKFSLLDFRRNSGPFFPM
ncbi:hypothetical protein ACFOW1_05485 [Parasediminibacterium paludis]|uniref:Uncharacterized protein n=1 Tax=Parasediminibacterium paludis TaxID=908966 RepID=A0ABV8PTJ7_9BACT